MGPEYLFIRILNACNVNCFMCEFRLSKDQYRFSLDDLLDVLPRARGEGIRYVRLTGGEPLIHADIVEMVRAISRHGMRSSIITSGGLLSRKIEALVDAGLSQVIVSLDGLEATHDRLRGSKGLFCRAWEGLQLALARGVHGRVNTVCGPENFREMPALQDLLTERGVHQWELSSLKLERPLEYTPADIEDVEAVVQYVYRAALAAGRLLPRGKVWCGETEEEKRRYFATGITPRADGECHLVDRVRYLDARNRRLYACSLIAHRPNKDEYAVPVGDWRTFSVSSAPIQAQADHFKIHGPNQCTGCSSTAAGFSDEIRRGAASAEWSY